MRKKKEVAVIDEAPRKGISRSIQTQFEYRALVQEEFGRTTGRGLLVESL